MIRNEGHGNVLSPEYENENSDINPARESAGKGPVLTVKDRRRSSD